MATYLSANLNVAVPSRDIPPQKYNLHVNFHAPYVYAMNFFKNLFSTTCPDPFWLKVSTSATGYSLGPSPFL